MLAVSHPARGLTGPSDARVTGTGPKRRLQSRFEDFGPEDVRSPQLVDPCPTLSHAGLPDAEEGLDCSLHLRGALKKDQRENVQEPQRRQRRVAILRGLCALVIPRVEEPEDPPARLVRL